MFAELIKYKVDRSRLISSDPLPADSGLRAGENILHGKKYLLFLLYYKEFTSQKTLKHFFRMKLLKISYINCKIKCMEILSDTSKRQAPSSAAKTLPGLCYVRLCQASCHEFGKTMT